MANYQPPNGYFDGQIYNSSNYNGSNSVTLSYANQNYLSRVGSAVSIANSTNFENSVQSGSLTTDNILATNSENVNLYNNFTNGTIYLGATGSILNIQSSGITGNFNIRGLLDI